MADFKVTQSYWDNNLPDEKFRFVHENGIIKILHNGPNTKVTYTDGDRPIHKDAMKVWKANSAKDKWNREEVKFKVGVDLGGNDIIQRVGYVYFRDQILIGGDLHRITMARFTDQPKVLYGYLHDVDDNGHTGQWR